VLCIEEVVAGSDVDVEVDVLVLEVELLRVVVVLNGTVAAVAMVEVVDWGAAVVVELVVELVVDEVVEELVVELVVGEVVEELVVEVVFEISDVAQPYSMECADEKGTSAVWV
jgi:hypothetical protein